MEKDVTMRQFGSKFNSSPASFELGLLSELPVASPIGSVVYVHTQILREVRAAICPL